MGIHHIWLQWLLSILQKPRGEDEANINNNKLAYTFR